MVHDHGGEFVNVGMPLVPLLFALLTASAAGTAAGISEDLQVSLATAGAKNPAGVIQLAGIQSFLFPENLCSAPFIESEPYVLRRYLRRIRAALLSPKGERDGSQCSQCLTEIEAPIAKLQPGTHRAKPP